MCPGGGHLTPGQQSPAFQDRRQRPWLACPPAAQGHIGEAACLSSHAPPSLLPGPKGNKLTLRPNAGALIWNKKLRIWISTYL